MVEPIILPLCKGSTVCDRHARHRGKEWRPFRYLVVVDVRVEWSVDSSDWIELREDLDAARQIKAL
jgi:hypothetical protein